MMDIMALYSSIDHSLDLACNNTTLEGDMDMPARQKEFLSDSINFILQNNYFTYNSTYLQKQGDCHGYTNGTYMR